MPEKPIYDDAYYDARLNELIGKMRDHKIAVDEALVRRAFSFAREMHGTQERDSGEPFVIHPLMVAIILADLYMDQPTIVAALLHDCLEDTRASTQEIEQMFTNEVLQLVEGVTKLETIEFLSKDQAKAESLRKMFIAMAKDLRVVIIKLADRLHNMRTLRYRNEIKRVATAKETLEVYAPLAHRLGIYTIKWELEDLSLRFMDPHSYYELVDMVAMKREEREQAIAEIIANLHTQLREMGIEADIDGRPKHLYSIFRKMQDKEVTFDQVYDLIAVRVIVPEIRECYAVLGTVHTTWKPIPGRFKDYISMPKPNLYQSLHTTVISEKGMAFEVQIRTREMHSIAEYGVAAHWRYKEGASASDGLDERLKWIRQINDAQNDVHDANEFVDMLKVDLFSDEVFVFTPKGDVIDLPSGSTPLDFAYRIHTKIGDSCVGAMVNHRIVTLDTPLETGDIVEIRTSASSKGPSTDWLKIVKTTQARSKIRAALKRNLRDQNILIGREMLENEARRQSQDLNRLLKKDIVDPILDKLSLHTVDDLYASVGFGGLSAVQMITRLADTHGKLLKPPAPLIDDPPSIPERSKRAHPSSGTDITIKGMDSVMARFAHCCNPVPGDEIIGYITRGRGVSVHRTDCINAIGYRNDPLEQRRLIEVSWANAHRESYKADIRIIAYSHQGLVGGIINTIGQQSIPFTAFSVRADEATGKVDISITLEIRDTTQLDTIIRILNQNTNIIEVFRGGGN